MTVGLDDAAVENVLGSGLLRCPAAGCGEPLGPWGWARGRGFAWSPTTSCTW